MRLTVIGRTLGHFRIVDRLGKGGMGEVYRAEDTRLKRDVAIKILSPELAGSQERLERFQREAEILAALDHPNIVTIYSVEHVEEVHFLAMQLVEGKSLAELIPGDGFALQSILEIALPLSEALSAAHEKGVIHRDLKPGNVMVTDDGRVKVLDFGLAKATATSEMSAQTDLDTEPLTEEGRILGTVAYMSPEQVEGRPLDARSDIFSFGVVLYQMATGRRPFAGDTPISTLSSILHTEPPAVSSLRHELPAMLDSIVSRCLEKNPANRIQSASALRDELRKIGDGVRDSGPAKRPRRIAAAVLAGAAVLAAVLLLRPVPEQDAAPARHAIEQTRSRGPTIAVLPFANASGDPEQDYFSDGLTEEIITELTRFGELFVIARDSTARYKESSMDISSVGRELGARYVLEGSVRKAGDRLRVTAQLSDTSEGRQVWGQSYDRNLTVSDVFSLQDELTLQVVNAIAGSYGALARAELAQARRKPPASLESYDCVLRTYEYLHVHTAANHLAARDCLERVIDLDPDYAEGRAWLAYLYSDEYHHRYNERPDEYDALDRALALAEEAARLDPASQPAHGGLALIHFIRQDPARGKIEAQRAIDINPNNALWLAMMGQYLAFQGEFELAMPLVHKAIELNPHPPGWMPMALFFDHYHHGRYEEALSEAKKIVSEDDFRIPLLLAATYGQLDRLEEARLELEAMHTLWTRPVEEIGVELHKRHGFSSDLIDGLIEGLIKAGLEDVREIG